jgi:hypothetical protein
MSVAEMKVKAIEKLAALQDEAAVKEILEHLEKLNAKKFDADDFFKKTSEQYGEVLKKLAE